jgi:hypothetical protein
MAAYRSHYDSAWKDALDAFFTPFMALLWPDMCARIDWRRKPQFLDKELRALGHSRARGRRHVDKLVSVLLLDGKATWLLIHIEVQGRASLKFAERMYEYRSALRARHPGRPLASLAILTAQRKQTAGRAGMTQARGAPKPSSLSYTEQGWGASLKFTFPVVYVEDWRAHIARLREMAPRNAFAVVLLAQLQANAVRKSEDDERMASKVELMRHLLKWGYGKDNVGQLFSVIDAMLTLPEHLHPLFVDTLKNAVEEESAMAYVTSFERVITDRVSKQVRAQALEEGRRQGEQQGIEQGMQQGIAQGMQKGIQRGLQRGHLLGAAEILSDQLTRKFGPLPDWAQARMAQADESALKHWAMRILDAQRIEDVFQS